MDQPIQTGASTFHPVTADASEITAAMPPYARKLVAIIGLQPSLDVLRMFPGDRLFIPSHMPADAHPLVVALGAEVIGKLVANMGGRQFDVPLLTSVERILRNRANAAHVERWRSRRYGCCRPTPAGQGSAPLAGVRHVSAHRDR